MAHNIVLCTEKESLCYITCVLNYTITYYTVKLIRMGDHQVVTSHVRVELE